MAEKAVENAHEEAMAECEKEKQFNMDLVSQYESELAELDQIAKPSVRYDHVTKVKVVTEKTEESLVKSSLLEQGAFTKDACVAFLQFQKKKRVRHSKNSTEPEEKDEKDCDTEREELQKAF